MDWDTKRLEVFRSMSPYMKASWCRPVPGSPLAGHDPKSWPERVDEPDEKSDTEEEKTKKKNWDTALSNFALLLIDPSEVDYVDLAVKPNQRTRFWITQGRWEEQALVP